MADTLTRHTEHWGNWPVYFGAAQITDNHGNSWSGRTMECHGHKPLHLSVFDYAKLALSMDQDFVPALMGNTVTFDGLESPMVSLCSQSALAAPRQHRVR